MKHILLSVAALLISAAAHAQFSSVSTNLAGWAVGNLNAAMDFSLDKRNTINIPVSGNPFSFGETRWQHIAVQPGWRHWLVERYIGHFISPSLFYANYRLGYDRRTYEGNAYGAGFSWGYSILLNTRWNFLVEVGAGIIYTPYDEKAAPEICRGIRRRVHLAPPACSVPSDEDQLLILLSVLTAANDHEDLL